MSLPPIASSTQYGSTILWQKNGSTAELTTVAHDEDEASAASQRVAIIFSPDRNRDTGELRYGGKVLIRKGIDVVVIYDTSDSWHQNIGCDEIHLLNNALDQLGYTRRLAYGSSAGGFAALALSKMLRIDFCLLMSPRFSMMSGASISTQRRQRYESIQWRFCPEESTVSDQCRFVITYDNKSDDLIHINSISQLLGPSRTVLVPIPYAGHPTTLFLREAGLLSYFVGSVMESENVPTIDLKSKRSASISYLKNLSLALKKSESKSRWLQSINNRILSRDTSSID